jgi:hypothetical protein
MELSQVSITLPEGVFNVTAQIFDSSDDVVIRELYTKWLELSTSLRELGGRGVNIPEVIAESVFCRAMGTIRINSNIPSVKTSFDVFNLSNNKRIQVKACSVLPDLTSFGPKSVWDEIYFLDFYRDGDWDGKVDIYLIPNNLIYNNSVNKNQIMSQQQLQGKRPRFSIYKKVILVNQINPIMTYQI